MNQALLDARITVDYTARPGVLDDLRFQVAQGEICALAGASGCGKSTFALAVLRLLDPRRSSVRGQVHFAGRDLLAASEREMRRVRGREIGLVPQSPLAALNPAMRIGAQLAEAWDVHSPQRGRERESGIREALEGAALPPERALLGRYPRELSVGMAQRVLIAMAVLHRPKLLIADEATSALDLIAQSEILKLFRELNRRLGASVVFITHDLAAAAAVADRIAVMYAGRIVETGPTLEVLGSPRHPYTRELVDALPVFAPARPGSAGFAGDLLRLSHASSQRETAPAADAGSPVVSELR